MITPKDIETKNFSETKGGGYRAEEVDQFLDEILVDYSHLLEERNALKNKVNLLTEKLSTLVQAEPIPAPAPVVTDENTAARQKAQRLVSDAEDYAKKLIETAQTEANRQNSVAQKLATEIDTFRASLLELYDSHIAQIKKIPDLKYEDVKIGSETLDILKESFDDDSAPAVAPSAFAADAPAKNNFVFEAAEPEQDPEETIPFEIVTSSSEPARRAAPASKGLEELFDDDDAPRKKKEKKQKRKLFFRDDEEEDDDLFDDDDE